MPPRQALRALAEILGSSAVRSVLLVTGLGLAVELIPGLGPLRILRTAQAPTRTAVAESPAPDAAVVGSVEVGASARPMGLGLDEAPAPRAPLFGGTHADEPEAPLAEAPPVSLIDPSGHALDNFYASLDRTRAKVAGATTRVAHFGDSIIVSDYVSGTLRRLMQKQFGDAGHGYQLVANAWPAYFHNDVFRKSTGGFKVSRIVGPEVKDGLYGLGGVTFSGHFGLLAEFGTVSKGDFGRSVSRFEVSYLERPGGGHFSVRADGKELRDVDTSGETVRVRRARFELPDAPHHFEIQMGRGESRLFGVTMERDSPGVVWDALGVQGARIRFLDKQDDQHFADELRWRAPALLVFQFGANESGDGYAYPMPDYYRTMKEVLEQARRAVPEASCLLIGAMDRARVENGEITSMRIIQLIIAEQEKVARDVGCAYFDTYRAMGGFGSMPRWVRRGLGNDDLTHPSSVGADRLGTWIYRAILEGYQRPRSAEESRSQPRGAEAQPAATPEAARPPRAAPGADSQAP